MANIMDAGSSATTKTPAQIAQERYLASIKSNIGALGQYGITNNAITSAKSTTGNIGELKTAYNNMYNPTTPTATSATTAAPTANAGTPQAPPQAMQQQAPQQMQQQPQYDINSQIQSLRDAQIRRQMGILDSARSNTLSSLQKERSTIAPQYYDKGNEVRSASANSARNFSEFLAQRGLSSAGVSAEGMLKNQGMLQGNLGSLGRQEQSAYDDIARRTSDAETAYQQGLAAANSEADIFASQQMLAELQKQRDYGREDSRNSILDSRYNKEYADSRGDVQYNRQYQQSRDLVGDTGRLANGSYTQQGLANQANITGQNLQNAYQTLINQGYPAEQAMKMQQAAASLTGTNLQNNYQTLINAGYPQQQAADLAQKAATLNATKLNNEAQVIANKFAPQIAQGQINAQTLANSYQTMVNANYPKEEAAKIAGILAQNAGIKLDNDAQALANKYYPEIVKGQIDGAKLQNAYQQLVNNGYSKAQAADIAAKYANIAQGNAQIAISQQNANTNAAQSAWAQDPKNPDNIYKNAQIQALQTKAATPKPADASATEIKIYNDLDANISDPESRKQWILDNTAQLRIDLGINKFEALKKAYGIGVKPTTGIELSDN